jgi:hypothetical protein
MDMVIDCAISDFILEKHMAGEFGGTAIQTGHLVLLTIPE